MFPTFISILDIQSWWEVPSIAHFCSLFRTAFNLLDFDIEDLEEALLTDGTEESSWLQELIVRLLSGCLPNNEISTFNYQMFLRRLFRQKCQEHDTYNPFNTDIDFQLLPLRTKVDILHALCDFRLDAEDVLEQLKNLEADSLRVEPLGYDSNESAYWYFYGTRLYREDFQTKNNKKKSVWQVICFTEEDWFQLAKKFKKSTSKVERQLYHTLNENFLPELPRLFKEKERLARKRLLENQPRRTSSRLRKLETEAEKDEQNKLTEQKVPERNEEEIKKNETEKKRREAYERRSKLKELSEDSQSEQSLSRYEMTGAKSRDKKAKGRQRKLSEASTSSKDTYLSKNSKRNKKSGSNDKSGSKDSKPTSVVGRQTNNSLAAATGQIVIQSVSSPTKKKLKTSQVFRQTDEDLQTGMHKILDYVKNHKDAWPFADPVEEEYAPNYYSIIRKPMDLQRMEERLDSGYYKNYSKFRTDFQLIVDNCRLYNGAKNEYTEMVDNLQKVFERATEKYLDQISSSDDEIAIEFTGKSEIDNKTNMKKRKSDTSEKSITNPKRKPVLMAQTDKKRDRSLSEESLSKQSDIIESRIDREEKNAKSKKIIEKVTKKQTKTSNKSSKHDKERDKEKLNNAKKSTKEKSVKQKKTGSSNSKKEKKASTDRSVSRASLNSSPPPSYCSSPPPSWPPSSPDTRFDFSPKKHKKRQASDCSDDDIAYNKSKHKKKCDDDNEKSKHQEKKQKRTHSPPLSPKPKDKHNKLRETIEKLKAKSEMSSKIKSEYDFHIEDTPKENKDRHKKNDKEEKHKSKNKSKPSKKEVELEDGNSTLDSVQSDKKSHKKTTKHPSMEALTLATEQTLKDINKWLDDTPKFSEFSSASNSPSYGSIVEDLDTNKPPIPQDPTKKVDKLATTKKDSFVKDLKRRQFRDPAKFFKRREIQRTIDRLQPGKSKGNLITTVQNTNKTDEVFPLGPLAKVKDTKNSLIVKTDTNAPKLSLGSVLDSFGKHKFIDDQKKDEEKCDTKKTESTPFKDTNNVEEKKETVVVVEETKECTETVVNKENDEGGATPNLSAWFKAFGAPKVQTNQKKNELKADGKENEKLDENRKVPLPEPSPNPDSPVMTAGGQPIARQRKISTGSSMSERSSFSQDMDSPRVGIDERLGAYPAPYPSPLQRSPSGASPVMASPRPDVSPKAAAYPTFNGQIRVGFYQDTVSNKSSPDKSCSPRDNSQSPAYGQYSEHFSPNNSYSYTASPYYNNAPNFSNTNPPYNAADMGTNSYYDTNKSLTDQYQAKSAQNYTANSPASNMSSPISHPQHSPTVPEPYQEEQHKIERIAGPQSAMFPVKKRAYNDTELNNYDEQIRNQTQEVHINEHKENKEIPKAYIHQNIPDPKAINMDTYKGQGNMQHQQLPSTDMRNFAPTTSANAYSSYSTDPNYMNVPPSRSLTSPQPTLTDLDRKVDMNKYTNMGYNGPDVNFSRNLQQYNRPELNYTRTTTGMAPPSQHQSQPNQSNDMHMRYVNPNVGIHMNYKSMDLNPNQQTHHNYNTASIAQNTRPMAPQDVPPSYKQAEVSIPRPTYTAPPIDVEQPLGLRGNLTNLSHIVDRCCPTDERMLTGLQATPSSYYSEKGLSASQMFNKPISTSASPLMFSQTNVAPVPSSYNQNIQATSSSMYNRQLTELQSPNVMTNDVKAMQQQPLPEKKTKKRKNAKNAVQPNPVDQQQTNPQGFQSYAGIKNNATIEPSAISLKTSSVVPGSAFNFGPTPTGIGLSSGLYGDKDAYHANFLDDFRSAPNYYMAAAAAHHRATPESNEKQTRVAAAAAHQSSATPQAGGYPFLGAPQPRPSYPISGAFMPPPTQAPLMDTSSPLYQHYLQAGVLNQGLLGAHGAYPPGYHPALSMRQPYDSMTRPPWL